MAIKKCKNHLFEDFLIPDYMESGVNLYIQFGIEPGSFLRAVICNDLKRAVMYADRNNMGSLPAYVDFFYNNSPMACWGSEKLYKAWIKRGGLKNDNAD